LVYDHLMKKKPKFNNKKEIAANGKEGENQSRQEKGLICKEPSTQKNSKAEHSKKKDLNLY
jgi:hypothetical protein